MSRCKKAGESDEEMAGKLSMTDRSAKGICGLRNIGNTCYMNSGL